MMMTVLAAAIAISPFDSAFVVDTAFQTPAALRVTGRHASTDWSFCAVSPDGARMAYIDPEFNDVRTYDLAAGAMTTALSHTAKTVFTWSDSTEVIERPDGSRYLRVVEHSDPIRAREQGGPAVGASVGEVAIRTVVRQGRKQDEVNTPVALAFGHDGSLLVSDVGSRRVIVMGPDGNFRSSFLLGDDEDAPSEMRLTPDGNLLCANLRLDRSTALNAGHNCNVYSMAGVRLQSFAYTPASALARNLWTGVRAVLDVDRKGYAFVAFSIDPEIHVWDSAGQERRAFGGPAAWFVSPRALRSPLSQREVVPTGFHESWTRPIKIVCFGDDHLLRATLANDRVAETDKPFLIDVFSIAGTALGPTVASDAWPVGADSAGHIYFLTAAGDRLLKAHLTGAISR
ncbi:MAG: hypothetical protein HZB43_13375 [candidate division Zixibacteria bacterium]|nr:hypothetical protein [candidate division Zixibacteria bacterium]